MSDLQIPLMVLGALVIVCVIAYNRLQESRFRKRAEDSFGGERDDALLKPTLRGRSERIEPHMQPDTGQTERFASKRVEPAGMPDLAREGMVGDDLPIDYTVHVSCEHKLQGPALHPLLDALDGLRRRPHIMASLADGIWVPLANAPTDVSEMRVALQLADRRGHVTEDDLAAFCGLVTHWAQGVGAVVRAPDLNPYLQSAKDLDRFCADVDVVVGLSVVAPSRAPFSGTKLRSCAEAAGSRLENGAFRFEDAHGAVRYCLENQQGESFDAERLRNTTIGGATLLLDVPRLEQGVKVFDQMIETGRQLANCLGGTLVDDNRIAVTEAGLEHIRVQLRQIYGAMEARSIRGGSDVALRLFS